MTFSGVTEPLGGTELLAGGAFTTTVAIAGVTVGMSVAVTPRTFPGNGVYWLGYVSSAGIVTVKVGVTIALFVAASIYGVLVDDGSGGGGGLPSIVATVNMAGNTGSIAFDLLAAPNGQYVLNDVIHVTTADSNSKLVYSIAWNPDGVTAQVANVSGIGNGSMQGLLDNQGFVGKTAPTTIIAQAGAPIAVSVTITTNGGLASAVPSAGGAGLGYTIGDTVGVLAGNFDAVLTVGTVNGSGGVLTLTVSTPGTDYSTASGQATFPISATGSGLTVNITAAASLLVYDYDATLMQVA